MYLKLPLDADLSQTSYRCCDSKDDHMYIEYNEGYINEDWEEVPEFEIMTLFPTWFDQNEDASTQLDRIEENVNNNAIDSEASALIIMEAIAHQYEQQQADNLTTMEAQAAIYEEILTLKEQLGGTE